MAGEDFQSKATDLFKKVLTVGVGTVFLTEESLRTLVSEFKLPKELIQGVLDSASKTKKEFIQGFADEIIQKIVTKVDAHAFVDELVQKYDIDLNIKVRLSPKKETESSS